MRRAAAARGFTALSLLIGLTPACGESASSPPGGGGGSSAQAVGATSSGAGAGSATSSTSSGVGGNPSGSGGGANAEPVCPPDPGWGDPLPATPTAAEIQGGFHFLEGPVWFAGLGRLFFSDMDFSTGGADNVPMATIYELEPPSTISTFIATIGSNGLAIDNDEQLVACTHDERSVSRIDPSSQARTTIAGTWMGDKFNSPNDAVVRNDGTIYFTDPTWQLGNRTQEISFKGVYRITPSQQVELVADDFGSPNGIALSPDEAVLYVADDAIGHVRSFAVSGDGATTGGAVFASGLSGADGMAVDCAGNVYVTSHSGIRVFDASANDLGTIAVGQKANNCTFGGADRKTLYIAAGDTLYSINLNVPGLP